MAVDRTTATNRVGQANLERESAREMTSESAAIAAASALLAAFGGGVPMAHAQLCPPESPPRLYHPRPLVKLGGLEPCSDELDSFDRAAWYAGVLAGTDQLGVLAVNALGEIVGTEIASGNCLRPRPFVFLPNANYGRSAGKHDLIDWSGGSSETIGYAWDITDDGLVVGGIGGRPDTLVDGACRAVAWDLANSCATNNLDSAPSARNLWSIALAAEPLPSAGAELRIVGLTGDACPLWRRNARFSQSTGTSGPVDLTLPDPYLSLHPTLTRPLRSWAGDVANLANPVGVHDWPSGLDPGEFTPNVECPEPWLPGTLSCELPFWCGAHFQSDLGSPVAEFFRRDPTVTPLEAIAGQMTKVRSISHGPALREAIGDFVVAGQFQMPTSGCAWLPALWRYGSHAVAIEVPLPPGAPHGTAQRWREAFGTCGSDTIVGWRTNDVRPNGLVWSRCPTAGPWDFCVTDADKLMQPYAAIVDGRYEVLQVYEVFNTGALLAIVRDSLSTAVARGYYAVILGLRGDANGDFSINSQDLAAVLNSWGSDSAMGVDFEKDGIINAADISIVLSEWSGSNKRPLALTCGPDFCVPDIPSSGEGEPSELSLALGALGFGSVDAFRVAAPELDQCALDFTCHMLHCFMRIHSEETE